MAGGYWPIDGDKEDGKKLKEAIRLADEVYGQVGYDDNQTDNAYEDGRYKEDLCQAIYLMKMCLRPIKK